MLARFASACVIVALVLAAFYAAGRLWVRPAPALGGRSRIVAVLETTMLSGAAAIHVVRVAERYYAIGRCGAAMATLCEIPADGVTRRAAAMHASAAGSPFLARFRRPRA